MTLVYILYYLVLGALIGLLSGTFGLGGCVFTVPLLSWVFMKQGLSAYYNIHMAIATSLAVMIFTSLAAIHTHHQKKAINWRIVGLLSYGIAIGAIAGPIIDTFLS